MVGWEFEYVLYWIAMRSGFGPNPNNLTNTHIKLNISLFYVKQ
jgi:hypothetical protein